MDTDSALATGVACSVAVVAVVCLVHNWYRARRRRPMSESDVSERSVSERSVSERSVSEHGVPEHDGDYV